MKGDWHVFLKDAGAIIENGRVCHFGSPETESEAALSADIIADLSHFALLRVTGADAVEFLQGQFSNDVKAVSERHSQLNAYCSVKGRVLASFRLFQREGAYYLRLPADLLEATRKRLQMYVLRSQVSLEEASDALAAFGLSGAGAEARLAELLGPAPGAVDESMEADGVTVIRVPGPRARFELYGPPSRMRELWQQLADTARPVGEDAWQLLDIEVGIPHVVTETVEAFVPQMINLHAIDGVSFRKGCYPGQEVVARMQYLGKLKRRMYLAHLDSPQRPLPGTALVSAGADSAQGAGKVVDARPAPGGGFDLLAVIQIADADGGTPIHLENEQGPELTLRELPYRVRTSKEEE